MPDTLSYPGTAPSLSQAVPEAARRPRPVRVCFLIDELTPAGTETQLLALIRRLDRTRVRPYLCLLRGANPVSASLEPDDCPLLRLDVRSIRSPATPAKLVRLWRFLRQERIDVLQTYFPESTYLGIPLGWLAGVPHLVRTRNNSGYWMTPWHRRLGRFCNWFARVTVANCDAARDAVIADEGLSANRVLVLENGVDLDRFPNPFTPRRSDGGRRVGVLANLRPVKGLDVFIAAAARLSREFPDVRFIVGGEGEQREELERLAATSGIAHCVELPGSQRDVPAFLAGLDVAVLSSRSEGLSNALLEYMAAGRPVVATAVGGNPRLIEHGVNGLLTPPNDPEALAQSIALLLREPELAARLAKEGRRRVETHYSREAMVRRFERFYLGLDGREEDAE